MVYGVYFNDEVVVYWCFVGLDFGWVCYEVICVVCGVDEVVGVWYGWCVFEYEGGVFE